MRYRDNQELKIIFRKYITNISTLQYNYANIVNAYSFNQISFINYINHS